MMRPGSGYANEMIRGDRQGCPSGSAAYSIVAVYSDSIYMTLSLKGILSR
jgi:hypothetical protein